MTDAMLLLNLTHLRFKGPDAERYLNGQVTQQVEGLPLAQSRYTFVCDAKGRIQFDGYIRKDEEGLLLSIEGADREEAFARMDRYLIADDCELLDESERWGILHEPLTEAYAGNTEGLVKRFQTFGSDHYREGTELEKLQALRDNGPSLEELEDIRIKNGVARLPDLQEALPAETGLEDIAVSYHKGCYLGQEVISRMKRAGRTNRKLTPIFLSSSPSELPLNFTSPDSDKTMLEVSSCASSECENGFAALGYLSAKAGELSSLSTSTGIQVKR